MKKAIIFDLDETLVYLDFKTIDCHDDFLYILNIDLNKKEEIINEMMIFFKEFNIYFKDKKANIDETKELLLATCPFINKYKLSIDEVVIALFDATINCTKEYEESIEVLEYLKSKDYDLYILTNWFEYVQIGKLKKTGLYEYFDKVYCIDNRYLKPNPKVLDEVLENYTRKECMIIGDNYDEDILLGIKNDIDTVWINRDYKEKQEDLVIRPTYIINSLNELKNIL